MSYKLPDLPFDFNELEPVISGEIMELHYKKHHNGYVTKLNEAIEKYQEAEKKQDIEAMLALGSALKFNGGGHVNHSIFWTNLAPVSKGGGELPTGKLKEAIDHYFGSIEKFIEKFNAKTAGVQGSGWGWLAAYPKSGCLCIQTMSNQDPLSITGKIPLLGVDVWEHAYYLQYKNVRPDYLKNIWKVVNWKNVEERYNKIGK